MNNVAKLATQNTHDDRNVYYYTSVNVEFCSCECFSALHKYETKVITHFTEHLHTNTYALAAYGKRSRNNNFVFDDDDADDDDDDDGFARGHIHIVNKHVEFRFFFMRNMQHHMLQVYKIAIKLKKYKTNTIQQYF